MTSATLPDLIATRLRADPTAPLVTFYDDATGERTELSVASFANWVAKTANLLVEELDLEGEDTLLLDLPVHWLVPVFLAGAWSAGLAVTDDPGVEHAAVVTGPGTLEAYADQAGALPVLACALHPMALRSPEPLPAGVLDHGSLWPGQGDVFVAPEPPTGETSAWRGVEVEMTHADVLTRAAAAGHPSRTRLLTDRHPAAGAEIFPGPLVASGSLVLVRHADDASWQQRASEERTTAVVRS